MDRISFNGRVAIVTGAGGGLGRTYALELASRGAAVVVNDLGGRFDGTGKSHSMADQVVEEIRAAGGRAVANYDSVGTREGGEAIVRTALDSFGRVDVVINNAGHLRNALFDELQKEDLDSLIEVHLKGAFYVSQPAFKVMKQQGYGRLVFASSAVGMFGNATQSAYGAAKAGLVGLMHTLSLEGAPHGILCNALLPTATSRMGEAMDPQFLKDMAAKFFQVAGLVGNSHEPRFVTPLVVYLASEVCDSNHAIYSSTWGRYARVFVGICPGWQGPRDAPASAEDIAAHWKTVQDQSGYAVLGSLDGEFDLLLQQIRSD